MRDSLIQESSLAWVYAHTGDIPIPGTLFLKCCRHIPRQNRKEIDVTALSNMKNRGQSIWLGEITRCALEGGVLKNAVDHGEITGAALSVSALCRDIQQGKGYDKTIKDTLQDGLNGAALLDQLLLEDIRHTADILRPVYERTERMDGLVLAPLSPLIFTQNQNENLDLMERHGRINRPNVLHMVPGLNCSAIWIEETICSGHPLAISPICSAIQYTTLAEAYLNGVERRIALGLQSGVSALAVVPIMGILTILSQEMQPAEALQISFAIAQDIYRSMRELHTSPRWEKAYGAGARPLRILWMNMPSAIAAPMAVPLAGRLATPLSITVIPKTVLKRLGDDVWKLPVIDEQAKEYYKEGQTMKCLQQYALFADRMQTLLAVEEEEWILLLEAIASKSATLAQEPRIYTGGKSYATLLGSRLEGAADVHRTERGGSKG